VIARGCVIFINESGPKVIEVFQLRFGPSFEALMGDICPNLAITNTTSEDWDAYRHIICNVIGSSSLVVDIGEAYNKLVEEPLLLSEQLYDQGTELVGPNYALFRFSKLTPPSLPRLLARSGVPSMFDDSNIMDHWKEFLERNFGKKERGFFDFGLQNETSERSLAYIQYNIEKEFFQIKVNKSADEKFRVFPKLLSQNIYITGLTYRDHNVGVPSSDVSGWANRVFNPDSDRIYYNGEQLVSIDKLNTNTHLKRVKRFYNLNEISQAGILAGIAGGVMGGIGQALTQAQQHQYDLERQKEMLNGQKEMLEAQLENARGMQREAIENQLKMLTMQMEQKQKELEQAKELAKKEQEFKGGENRSQRSHENEMQQDRFNHQMAMNGLANPSSMRSRPIDFLSGGVEKPQSYNAVGHNYSNPMTTLNNSDSIESSIKTPDNKTGGFVKSDKSGKFVKETPTSVDPDEEFYKKMDSVFQMNMSGKSNIPYEKLENAPTRTTNPFTAAIHAQNREGMNNKKFIRALENEDTLPRKPTTMMILNRNKRPGSEPTVRVGFRNHAQKALESYA